MLIKLNCFCVIGFSIPETKQGITYWTNDISYTLHQPKETAPDSFQTQQSFRHKTLGYPWTILAKMKTELIQWLIFHMSILETKGLTVNCKLHTSEHGNYIWLSNKFNSIHHIHIHLSLNQEPFHAIKKNRTPTWTISCTKKFNVWELELHLPQMLD